MSSTFTVRAADPSDARALTRLAEAVSGEPEAWLISANGEWRSVGDERRYLKALRRYPNAAVFVAERATARSSAGCRSRATRIRRARTSPISA